MRQKTQMYRRAALTPKPEHKTMNTQQIKTLKRTNPQQAFDAHFIALIEAITTT